MTFKICLIGCGGIAQIAHGPSLKKYTAINPGVELSACCDIDEEKASIFQRKFGFKKYYTDMFEMLNKENPDVVSLTVPTHLTAKLAVEIINRGYPLLMEKPPGCNKEEVMLIMNADQKNNIPIRVAYNRRYMPLVIELKDHMEKYLYTNIIDNIRYELYRIGRSDNDFSTTAIHGIDAVKFIAGSDYRYINFHYQRIKGFDERVVNIFMDCELMSGATAQLSFCPMTGAMIERATINANNNSFFLNLPIWNGFDKHGHFLHLEKGCVKRYVSGKDLTDNDDMFVTNGFYKENETFFNDVRNGIISIEDISTSIQSVEIMECIRNRVKNYEIR